MANKLKNMAHYITPAELERHIRIKRGAISLSDLSRIAGVSRQYTHRIINAKLVPSAHMQRILGIEMVYRVSSGKQDRYIDPEDVGEYVRELQGDRNGYKFSEDIGILRPLIIKYIKGTMIPQQEKVLKRLNLEVAYRVVDANPLNPNAIPPKPVRLLPAKPKQFVMREKLLEEMSVEEIGKGIKRRQEWIAKAKVRLKELEVKSKK